MNLMPLRILIPTLLLLSAVVAGFGSYTYMSAQGKLHIEKDNIRDVQHTLNLLQASINILLRRNDFDGIKIQLTSLATDHQVSFAVVVDEKGKVLSAAHTQHQGKAIGEVAHFLQAVKLSTIYNIKGGEVSLSSDKLKIQAIYPLQLPETNDKLRPTRTGVLVFEKNILYAKMAEQREVKQHVTIFLMIMLAMSLLVWLVFHCLITQRVNRLVKMTNRLSSGDLFVKTRLKGKDEFARVGQALDVMAEKLNIQQRNLAVSEERLRKSQKFSNMGNWDWNILTGDLYWSETIAPMFGLDIKRNQVSYDIFIHSVHPADRQTLEDAIQNCLENGEDYDIQHRIVLPDGQIRWMHETGNVERDGSGKPLRMLGNVRDITESKAINAQLHLQASALKATADGIVITDAKGTIHWVNPAYSDLTGYRFDEVIGKNPRILKSGQQDRTFYKNLWDTILDGKTWQGQLWNKRKNGKLYLEEETITPVLNQLGEIEHFIAIKRDISERQKLQTQLQQAQKMEAIGQLTGGIAHDFNNMLASIFGYTELAREACAQSDHQPVDGYLEAVYQSGNRARDLVSQMLAFSRGSEKDLGPLQLSTLIKDSLKMLTVTLPSSVEIDLDIDNKDLMIMSNAVQIHQLIMNLCINARDAMEGKGYIKISIQQAPNITIDCRSCHESVQGDYIKLVVGDTGSGIRSEQLDRIFDPFYTTKAVGKGTGMGLSMVHGIVHEHGGHIEVQTSHSGTTFTLLFPSLSKHIVRLHHEIEGHDKASPQMLDGNILIVDDDASVGRFIGELLKNSGANVTVETGSQAALKKFKKIPQDFDLLITDQTMPGLTGVELAQLIQIIQPELPIILCTGYSDNIDEAKAKLLGIKAYINKPIDSRNFLALVANLLHDKPDSKPSFRAVR